MTISSSARTAGPFLGNGINTNFPFTYKVFSRQDLLVALTVIATAAESILTLDSDYTVTLNENQDVNPGGVIRLFVAPPVGTSVAATSDVPIEQTLELTNNGGFYPRVINNALDKIVVNIQQLSARIGLGSLNVGMAAAVATVLSFIDQIAVSGAARIGFLQGGFGAIVRTLQDRFREQVSLLDFMTEEQRADVISRTFSIDVTVAVQRAIDYAASIRATLWAPAGLYKLTPATPIDDEDKSYITLAALLMRSNMHIEAQRGAVFKIADGVSSDAKPQSMGMFCTTGVLTDVSIRKLVMDMNGQNNLISPVRPTSFNRYNQSQILVSGTANGVAAAIDNMVLEYNTFQNNYGVCCVCAAQSNSPGVNIGRNWKINFNRFLENGYDTDDHTCVFAWVNDAQFIGNEIDNTKKYHESGANTGGNTGYEIHGLRHLVTGNKFRNYFRGIWVSSNLTDAYASGSRIIGNHFQTHFYAVDFFRTTGALGQPRNTVIANNTIEFDEYTFPSAPQQKSAFNISSEYAQEDILISSNSAISRDTVLGAAFVTITPQTVPGQFHNNVTVRGNTARGFVLGANIRTNAVNGLGHITIADNNWLEPITTDVFSVPIGEFIDPVSRIDSLVLSNNTMIYLGSVPKGYGTYIQPGTITQLKYEGGYAVNTLATYYEAGPVVANKRGVFEGLNYTPTLMASGSAVPLASAVGIYSIHDKQVTVNCAMTVGAGAIPNGNLTVSMPVVAAVGVTYLGNWRHFNKVNFALGVAAVDGTSAIAGLQVNGGSFAQGSTLVEGSRVDVQAIYTGV